MRIKFGGWIQINIQIEVLADLNLAVWYGIAICIHVRKKFGSFQFGGCEDKLPNVPAIRHLCKEEH